MPDQSAWVILGPARLQAVVPLAVAFAALFTYRWQKRLDRRITWYDGAAKTTNEAQHTIEVSAARAISAGSDGVATRDMVEASSREAWLALEQFWRTDAEAALFAKTDVVRRLHLIRAHNSGRGEPLWTDAAPEEKVEPAQCGLTLRSVRHRAQRMQTGLAGARIQARCHTHRFALVTRDPLGTDAAIV